jgi:hypothetical protein
MSNMGMDDMVNKVKNQAEIEEHLKKLIEMAPQRMAATRVGVMALGMIKKMTDNKEMHYRAKFALERMRLDLPEISLEVDEALVLISKPEES